MITRKLAISEAVSLFETPISLVSYNHTTSAGALPSHSTGDLIVAFCINFGGSTAIPLESGWTSESVASRTFGGSQYYFRCATKTAASGSETATWTNADAVTYVVVSGAGGTGSASSRNSTSTTSAELIDGDTLDVKNGTSFIVHATFGFTASANTVTPSNSDYTATPESFANTITSRMFYGAGLFAELPTTTLAYSPGGSTYLGGFLEITA